MRRNGLRAAAFVAAALGASACGNSTSNPTLPVPADIAGTSKLQFGVGTATINTDSGSFVGTNFTMTFRGPNGNNATGVNTPTITGPPSSRIGFNGSPNVLRGLAPLAFANDLAAVKAGARAFPVDLQESLGPYAGVFGYGMANDNQVSSQLSAEASADVGGAGGGGNFCSDLESTGDPTLGNLITGSASSQEIQLQLGSVNDNSMVASGCAGIPATLNPPNTPAVPTSYYGGPPAWPSPQGYGAPTFFNGFSLGFTDSIAAPVAGTYALDVAYPTSADYSTSAHLTASAHLQSVAPLPVMPKPSLVVDADGTGVVTVNIPGGLYETIVVISTLNCENTQAVAPSPYAKVVHASGVQTVVFAANLGPPDSSGKPSPTFCGSATVSALGFDYPAYESSYPFDNSLLPKITNGDGHTGQADVTTSPPLQYPAPPPPSLTGDGRTRHSDDRARTPALGSRVARS